MCYYEQFDDEIPQNLQNKITDFANFMKDEKILGFSGSQNIGEDIMIEPIRGVRIPGYVPFQCGGVDVSCLIHFSACITEGMAEKSEKIFLDAMNDFRIQHNFQNESYDDFDVATKENFNDFVTSYFYPALLRFSVFVSEEKDKVIMQIGVNYIDAPYYNVKNDETLFSCCVDIDNFLNTSFDDLWKNILSNQCKDRGNE